MFEPSYLKSYQNSELRKKKEQLLKILENCQLCPRRCRTNRLKDEKGFCGIGRFAKVSSAFAHFGEEPELVGISGSGTIFFSGCNLKCVYCQNFEISCLDESRILYPEELAEVMIRLQNIGCHNINFVTPTHVISQILEALEIAVQKGLKIPLVYNCGGYENVEVIKILRGIIDIYMPDAKYADEESAKKYSSAPNYWQVLKEVLKEMHSQVGGLVCKDGIAIKGLIIRHLVLPNRVVNSFKILDFIAKELSLNTYVNIMAQYRPCYKAYEFKELSRRITISEYKEVIKYASLVGLKRGFDLNV